MSRLDDLERRLAALEARGGSEARLAALEKFQADAVGLAGIFENVGRTCESAEQARHYVLRMALALDDFCREHLGVPFDCEAVREARKCGVAK